MKDFTKYLIGGGLTLLLGILYLLASRGIGLQPMDNATIRAQALTTSPTDSTYRSHYRRNFRSSRFYSGSGGFGK